MRRATCLLSAALLLAPAARGQQSDELADALRKLDPNVYPADGEKAKDLRQALGKQLREWRDDANRRSSDAWAAVENKAAWEKLRDGAIQALRASLGQFPPVPTDLKVRVTGTVQGKGVVVENLVFESRPGLVVTANLYRPDPPQQSMPGILICHSHHNPKTQGELQDMGVLWARVGCLVLVPDQLGHGERRQHPFTDSSKYDKKFQAGRQDYYFRYHVGNQLQLVGESLIGWMAWDMMRGVDVLLGRGADPKRIILLGSVAGGGDPTAVTAALDERIAAVAPFNFGGPQPETKYPLPDDAEKSFNYLGGGSWESTRGLRLSGRDGFLPWVIVGSVAPRGLIYAHEFAWDRERDPVWKRLEAIYGFYGARDKLTSAAGKGKLSGKAPESSHCNNIGAFHRREIHPALKKWFGIPEPDESKTERFPPEKLQCWTAEARKTHPPRPLHELAAELGKQRVEAGRARLAKLKGPERDEHRARQWTALLGPCGCGPSVVRDSSRTELPGGVTAERFVLGDEATPSGSVKPTARAVPVLLLLPAGEKGPKVPSVVMVAQGGKREFLTHRAGAIAELLRGGVAVCLPDLCGTGEAGPPSESRGRTSASTSQSATAQMLGDTVLGYRARDLAVVWDYLSRRGPVALWGDSFAPVNAPGREHGTPLELAQPPHAEPLGGLLAVFAASLSEPGSFRAVYARGGLTSYQSLLESQFIHVPHDALVPGALTAGDLADVAAEAAPTPLRLEGLVDGLNRRVDGDRLKRDYEVTRAAYAAAGAKDRFTLNAEPAPPEEVARWLIAQLKGK